MKYELFELLLILMIFGWALMYLLTFLGDAWDSVSCRRWW